MRLLPCASLAIRFYRQDEGHFPPSLAALVPNWLDAVPLDPFSEEALVYRTDDEGYVLYSDGPNRIDDGGHMVRLARHRRRRRFVLGHFRHRIEV